MHLPALGDVEIVAGHEVAHPYLALLGRPQEAAAAAILVEPEARLGETHDHVLVAGFQRRPLLLEEALHRGAAALLPIEEVPVEEGLHALLEAAVVLVHLAARAAEVLLLRVDDVVDVARGPGEQLIDLRLHHGLALDHL